MSDVKSERQPDHSTTGRPNTSGRGARGSIVGFDFQRYNQQYLARQADAGHDANNANDAEQYHVRIIPAEVAAGQLYWRAIGVRHLEPAENTGKHNVYAELLDEAGNRVRDLSLQLQRGWEGQRPDESAPSVNFDKGDNEPATNVPIDKGQNLWVRVSGALPSDKVENLRTDHPDEDGPNGEKWNTFGHHSYYVVFQRTRKGESTTVHVDRPTDTTAPVTPVTPVVPAPTNGTGTTHPTPPPPPPAGATRLASRIGLDANAPIDPGSGAIAPQVRDPNIIADTGVGWVRLNFILGNRWSSPGDTAQPHGLTWQQTYRQIIDGYRQRGLQIYGLIGSEAVAQAIDDRFRNAPGPDAIHDDWVQHYARNFAEIVRMFHREVALFESFNEPDDYHQGNSNWIHAGWFAVMLQAVYTAVHNDPSIAHVRLISGPLQGLEGPTVANGAPGYLDAAYREGINRFGWGQAGRAFPFDGVGYHLYVHERHTSDQVAQRQALAATYRRYIDEMRAVIRRYEGKEKELYISETGFHTNGDNREESEAFQASSLSTGLSLLAADPAVALVVNFCTQDFGGPRDGQYYGLYRPGSLGPENRKPVYQALQQLCATTVDRPTTTLVTPTAVDGATYVDGLDAIPDLTVMQPGQRFEQVWHMRNSGTTQWGEGYRLQRIGGEALGSPSSVPVPACAPSSTVAISVPFVTPSEPGVKQSIWRMANRSGELFGERVWLLVEVAQPRGVRPATTPTEPTASLPEVTPQPQSGGTSTPVRDPELYAAWKKHIENGFANNQLMFQQLLNGFMNPYWTTVWMYRTLFGLGVASFLVAALLTAFTDKEGYTLVFGGLSALSLLAYFFNRPLQALEENLQFITWLGLIYNSYWTRLVYLNSQPNVQKELQDATDDAIKRIKELMAAHAKRSGKRQPLSEK